MRRWARRVGAAIGAVALSFATGCGSFWVYPGSSSSGTSATGNYVYVANQLTDNIGAYAIGTGTLTAVSGSPFALGYAPTAAVVTPANTFLYVGSTSNIYAYSIGSGGALTLVNGSLTGSAVGTSNVVSMAVSPDGGWLLSLDGNDATIEEFQINQTTGTLTLEATPAYTTLITSGSVGASAIAIAPNGQYGYIALGTAGELVFTFATSTGVLAFQGVQVYPGTGTADNGLAVNPASSELYVARSGTYGGLVEFSIGTNGALTLVSTTPVTSISSATPQPYAVAVNNAGTSVFVANRLDGSISGFSIASTGALTALAGSPFKTGTAVSSLAMDQTGAYLLASAFSGNPDLSMYSFGSTGALDYSAVAATGTDPTDAVAVATTR